MNPRTATALALLPLLTGCIGHKDSDRASFVCPECSAGFAPRPPSPEHQAIEPTAAVTSCSTLTRWTAGLNSRDKPNLATAAQCVC